MAEIYFEDYIKNIILKRIDENKSYSIRSFARSIDEDSSMLSKIVRRKYKLSERIIATIGKKVGLDEAQIRHFVLLNEERNLGSSYSELSDDQLSEVFTWQAAAYLRSLDLSEPISQKDLASQLNLSESGLELLVEQLEKTNFIKFEQSKGYVRTKKQYLLKETVNGNHKKRLAKEFIQLALNSVDENKESERTHVSQVFSINHETYEVLKRKIHDFMIEISRTAQKDSGTENQIMLININLLQIIKN